MRVRLRQIILTRILWIERTEVVFMEKPLVSVVMPVYNGERYIGKAIESALGQEVPVEVLVIDDCSADGTELAVMKYMDSGKIRYIRNEQNMGAARSRNRGVKEARGKYIAFLDADDWWQEDKLLRQMALIREKNAILCATGRELMRADGGSLGRVIGIPQEITYEMLLRTNCIPCSAAVIRTEVAREFYMQHAELHEDYILWLRVLKKYGRAYGLDEPMLKSRMSEAGKSRNKLKSARMQFGVYRYLGFGIFKSLFYFVQYAVNGVKKYSK